jgi:sterol 3beta-glucosyltransferase
MKFILTSVGTRGDMEPFLAIGQLLKEKGHQVICAFPEQFRSLANDAQLEFASLGSKFIELLDSDAGRAAMGGATGFKKVVGTLKLAVNQTDANKELLFKQQETIDSEDPDRVIYNGKAVYPILWGLKTGKPILFVSPLPYMHYVEGHTHIAFNSNFGNFLNKASFSLAHFGLVTTIKMSQKWLKMKESISRKDIRKVIKEYPSVYTISPTLFSRPTGWHKNLQVLGYHERNQSTQWQPDQQLIDFIKKHPKILFITFGSMINAAPKEKTRIILNVLERHQIPAIINTAAGGLERPSQYHSDFIHFVNRIPYDWIFHQVYGVVHHGGSGTTHLAIKYGCASLIIPHIIDQFVWNRIIAEKGAGPKGVKIGKLKESNLEPLLLDLLNNTGYKTKAEEMGHQMKNENLEEELYQILKKGVA